MKPVTCCAALMMAMSASAESPMAVTVLYTDQVGIPAHVLRAAMADAAFLLGKAGLEITWVNCTPYVNGMEFPDHCKDTQPMRFRINITGGAGVSSRTLGFAFPRLGQGNHAAVLYPRVKQFAAGNDSTASVEAILGAAIAHELGHLFLGTTEHGPGVMSEGYDKTHVRQINQRRIRFTPVQAAAMRAALATRLTATASTY